MPEPRPKQDAQGNELAQDKHEPKPDDFEAVAHRRKRMAEPEAKEIYKQCAATAECVNAQARNPGLLRMPVRGLARERCVVGLFVLAHPVTWRPRALAHAQGVSFSSGNEQSPRTPA